MAEVYGDKPETILYKAPKEKPISFTHVLLGTWMEVVEDRGDWLNVLTGIVSKKTKKRIGGWVRREDVRDNPCLKVFYVDVGQGDGAIIEYPGGTMLIDGGPTSKYYSFIKGRFSHKLKEDGTVHIDVMVVSHPDSDHYHGFTPLLNDERFTFGTIYHNGIFRYHTKNLPAGRSFDLGKISQKSIDGVKQWVLTETFDGIGDIAPKIADGTFLNDKGNETHFHKFWKAATNAKNQGRLGKAVRLTNRTKHLPGMDVEGDNKLLAEVLGPVPTKKSGSVDYVCFPSTEEFDPKRDPKDNPKSADSSHTRNGHSIVLKLTFGKHTFLFGGDLNIPAQFHLEGYYAQKNPFEVDVAKACHHGSSDFSIGFLKKVKPRVNVISSGDNKSFDHPVADAIGALAHHTRGQNPLLFSTELARAVSSKGKTHYGLINARSNGTVLAMAQMKEQRRGKKDIWDSFTVPWRGKFHHIVHEDDVDVPSLYNLSEVK